MPQHITVVDYNAAWPLEFAAEREKISAVLGGALLELYHIGSTSVPGLAAKPVIDMLAAVRSLEAVDAAAPEFAALGYECLGEYGIPGRRFLRRGGDKRTHHIHAFRWDNWGEISRHLAFRDFLRGHSAAAARYAALKRRLAEAFPYDIEGYCDGKDAFVREAEAAALAAYDGSWERLYLAARAVQGPRRISARIEAGGVSAALLTEAGNVYAGVCVDTACSLGMCAERSAVAAMITGGESRIVRLLALMPGGEPGMPCGACRELLMQLGEGAPEIEILRSREPLSSVRLRELAPDWWL